MEVIKQHSNEIPISKVKYGEGFIYKERFYIKIVPEVVGNNIIRNAVNNIGQLTTFAENEPVIPVNCQIVILEDKLEE